MNIEVKVYKEKSILNNILETHSRFVIQTDDRFVIIDMNSTPVIQSMSNTNRSEVEKSRSFISKNKMELVDSMFVNKDEVDLRIQILSGLKLESSLLYDAITVGEFILTGCINKCVYGGINSNRSYNCGYVMVTVATIMGGAGAIALNGWRCVSSWLWAQTCRKLIFGLEVGDIISGALGSAIYNYFDKKSSSNKKQNVAATANSVFPGYVVPAGDGRTKDYQEKLLRSAIMHNEKHVEGFLDILSNGFDTGHILDWIISDSSNSGANIKAMIECEYQFNVQTKKGE